MSFGLRHMAARKCDAQECHRARGLIPTATGGQLPQCCAPLFDLWFDLRVCSRSSDQCCPFCLCCCRTYVRFSNSLYDGRHDGWNVSCTSWISHSSLSKHLRVAFQRQRRGLFFPTEAVCNALWWTPSAPSSRPLQPHWLCGCPQRL